MSAFDATLFHLTANEVELMDPQQRLLLEVSYEAVQTSHQQLIIAGKFCEPAVRVHCVWGMCLAWSA